MYIVVCILTVDNRDRPMQAQQDFNYLFSALLTYILNLTIQSINIQIK